MSNKYELQFKVDGFPWRTFDTYGNKRDPEIMTYAALLRSMPFNKGVKLIELKTTAVEIDIEPTGK